MTIPQFVLGHNALIGVHHTDKGRDKQKSGMSDSDSDFLKFVAQSGVEAIVLDNHPVAIEVANFLAKDSSISVLPMIPYAQAVVDKASSSGLSGVVKEMASSIGPIVKTGFRSISRPRSLGLTQIGAHLATTKYLSEYPSRCLGNVCFMHNVVTDLMLGWDSLDGIRCFSRAIRMNKMIPGFVTLNPQCIPEIIGAVGSDVWFMTSVNSAGIQMGPNHMEVEESILSDENVNILAMSLLGGGVLNPEVEVPRALSFPAVKSVVVGTSSKNNLSHLLSILDSF